MSTLQAFLESRRVTHANWNLTGMGKHVGRYSVSDDDYDQFLRIYHDYVFVGKHPAHLLERHSPSASPILIDLDFRYPIPLRRNFSHANITAFITAYAAAFHRFIVYDSPLRFYVQQIPAPLIDKDLCKDGVHIVCPDIALKYEDLFVLRKYTLDNNIIASFPGLTNTPSDCFDESVIKRNNWFLYGSSKSPERVPYSTTACFVLEPDGTLSEESVHKSSMEYVSMFSIRAAASSYIIRPEMIEEWATWKSICDQKPAKEKEKPKAITAVLVPTHDDADSVSTHRSEQISKLIKQPDLLWEIHEEGDGYKLTHNSYHCLVKKGHEHSSLNHSCIFVHEHNANMFCPSHLLKQLPKPIARALWNMLSNKITGEDELTTRYAALKAEFEQKNFRILDPPGYMTFVNSKWIHYFRAQLLDVNSGIFLDDDKKQRFIDWWLKDDTIRTYASMDYYVDPHDCPADVYNKYEGFMANKLPITSGDITPILDHVSLLCRHEAVAVDFLLDWFAQIVQTPWKLNGIAVVVMGTHGCGKDILMTWFGSQIVGMDNYHKTSRPHIDLFSAFNSSRKNAIFYHIEEGNSDAIQPAMVEQFKNYITDPYSSIQMKNQNTTALSRNYNHFVMTTNKKVPFHIEKTERRMFAVRASAEKCQNQAYFQRLSTAMADNGVIRGFYDFLRTRDLTGRDWCNPPATDALNAWKTECMPKLEPFIDYFKANNASPSTIVASRFYDAYVGWCDTTEEEPLSIRSFGLELKQFPGVAKGHSMAGNVYTIL